MKRINLSAVFLIAITCCPTSYGQSLSQAECRSYPFNGVKSPSRADLERELIELESVGYRPATANDLQYPDDIARAEQRLHAEYHADCKDRDQK